MGTPMATNYAKSNTTTNDNGLIGGGGGGGGSASEAVNTLARQGSMYSVEVGDFHRSLLEPGQMFGSMNIDEFLANNLTSAIMEGATESGEGGPADDQGNVASENGGGGASIRQPTLVDEPFPSIPPTMSRRTMDEVLWADINWNPSLPPSGSGSQRNPGILFSECFLDGMDHAFKIGQAQAQAHHQAQRQQQQAQAQQAHHQAQLLQQQQALEAQQAHHQAQLLQAQAHAANGMYNRAGNRGQVPTMNSNGEYMGMASSSAQQLGQMDMQFNVLALPAQSPASDAGVNGHGNGLSLLPVGTYGVDGSMGGRTRGADPERVERRRRRLIKTRESAEKSRARKEAHIAELEAEKPQLKEENNSLKKDKEKRANYIEWLNLESTTSLLQSDGKKKLRRTTSAPF